MFNQFLPKSKPVCAVVVPSEDIFWIPWVEFCTNSFKTGVANYSVQLKQSEQAPLNTLLNVLKSGVDVHRCGWSLIG